MIEIQLPSQKIEVALSWHTNDHRLCNLGAEELTWHRYTTVTWITEKRLLSPVFEQTICGFPFLHALSIGRLFNTKKKSSARRRWWSQKNQVRPEKTGGKGWYSSVTLDHINFVLLVDSAFFFNCFYKIIIIILRNLDSGLLGQKVMSPM